MSDEIYDGKPVKQGKVGEAERVDRHREVIDEMVGAKMEHERMRGNYWITEDQIRKEVIALAEKIDRKKDHAIYGGEKA